MANPFSRWLAMKAVRRSPSTSARYHARGNVHDPGNVWISDFYTPQEMQAEFHGSTAQYPLMEGGRGGGKTLALLIEAIGECLRVPGCNCLLLRRTLTA